MSNEIKTLAIATIAVGCASVASAQTPPYYPAPPGDYYRPEYQAAPYGYASPSYRGQYGTYPAPPTYTYDSDPYPRARQRGDFSRGADFPGR
jgi:hypothetical protein